MTGIETYVDAAIDEDTYLDKANPTTNYGTHDDIKVLGWTSSSACRGLIKVEMPTEPTNGKTIQSVKFRLKLSADSGGATSNLRLHRCSQDGVFDTGATWNKYDGVTDWGVAGGDLGNVIREVLVGTTAGVWYEFDVTAAGLQWGDTAWFILKYVVEDPAGLLSKEFHSADDATPADRPVTRIYYIDEPPKKTTNLRIEFNDINGRDRPTLVWTPNDETDFVSYQIYRREHTSPVTTADTLVATITSQSTCSYKDTDASVEGRVYYYAIFIEDANNTGADATKSNECWFIRPHVLIFTADNYAPDVLESILGTISMYAYPTSPSPPTPVFDTLYWFKWGTDGVDPDTSDAWDSSPARYHRYPYAGVQTPQCKVRNNLGAESDVHNMRNIPGPIITLGAIKPIAAIRASPRIAAVGETVRFYSDESMVIPGNLGWYPTGAFMWDKDYNGTFIQDYVTNDPWQDMTWSTPGTKTVALIALDEEETYSDRVIITVEVVAVSSVSMDTLTDSYEVLDISPGREAEVLDGINSYEIALGSELPCEVSIAGFAHTDSDADGIADDIETLQDIVANGKKVSLTIHGVSRTGVIIGPIKEHTEGGWGHSYNWSCSIVLE